MSLGIIPPGTVIQRVYYAVPGHYATDSEHDDWNSAVRAAQAKRERLIKELTASMGAYASTEWIAETADVQTIIELRWNMKFPDGGGIDTPVEKYGNVDRLNLLPERSI